MTKSEHDAAEYLRNLQVHHSAHRRHARKEYQDEESDDGASEDRIASVPEDKDDTVTVDAANPSHALTLFNHLCLESMPVSKDSAAEGQDDEPEPDVSRREGSRYDGDQEAGLPEAAGSNDLVLLCA